MTKKPRQPRSMPYIKLFQSILTSTIWNESNEDRIVWITLMALADKHGEIQGSIPGIARMANVDPDKCRAAFDKFLSEDPDSRSKTAGGRRLEVIDGGWALINHQKYRAMASKEDEKAKTSERVARHRARKATTPLNP